MREHRQLSYGWFFHLVAVQQRLLSAGIELLHVLYSHRLPVSSTNRPFTTAVERR